MAFSNQSLLLYQKVSNSRSEYPKDATELAYLHFQHGDKNLDSNDWTEIVKMDKSEWAVNNL